MRFRPFLICIVAAAALSAPSEAQRTGSLIGKNAGPEDAAAAGNVLAECLVSRRPEMIRRWFQLLPGTSEERALLHREADDMAVCMEDDRLVLDGTELHFGPKALRLPVALAAVRLALKQAPRQSLSATVSPPWYLSRLNALPADAAVDRAYIAWLDFGRCVAIHDWADSLALLASGPASPEERAVVKKLVPVLGPCITANTKLVLSPSNLRDALAEPVLHLVEGWAPAADGAPPIRSGGAQN